MITRVGLLLLVVGFWGTLSAQELDRPEITPEMFSKLAKQLELEPNSRHLRRILSDHYEGAAIQSDEELPVLKHFRGNQGIAFPIWEDINNKFEDTQFNSNSGEPDNSELMVDVKQFEAPITDLLHDLPQRESVPVCQTSITRGEALPVEVHSGLTVTTFDMLFLEAKHLPPDTATAFGEKTKVRVYSSDNEDGLLQAMQAVGVTCLPTRIRVTNKRRYWSEGLAALKNFDKDPDGQGLLDPEVSKLAN